jgi:deoxyribodipyrimidine photo-lyase
VVKQSHDQDPTGAFIRRWVPELARVPTAWIHEPYRMPPELQRQYGCVIGVDYPAPIVAHESAARAARQKLFEAYRTPEAKAISEQLLQRYSTRSRREPRPQPTTSPQQPELPL